MPTEVNSRFPRNVEDQLKKHLQSAAFTLRDLRGKLNTKENLNYVLQLDLNPHLAARHDIPILRALRAEGSFRNLFQFALDQPSIWRVLLYSTDPTLGEGCEAGEVQGFKNAIESMLMRICAFLELEASAYKGGTTQVRGIEEPLAEFIAFLAADSVERHVVAPLLNVRLSPDQIAITGFGRMQKVQEARTWPIPFPEVLLHFSIRTAHFAAAVFSPIWQEIRKRLTLIRLAGCPLAAYNHFEIQSCRPWEVPLADSEFSVRFWGKRDEKLCIPTCTLGEEHAAMLDSLVRNVPETQWIRSTAWRLACHRLDDAVFKLECRSADAILDIVIGLESVLTESSSRQESTHKVAIRAARFLEESVEGRQEVFRLVKQAYGARSTVAHGHGRDLDSGGIIQVEKAAKILAQILGRMALLRKTELNLTELDLS